MRQILDVLGDLSLIMSCDRRFNAVTRLAVTTYDARTDVLRSLAYAGVAVPAVDEIHCHLREVPALAILGSGHAPRIVHDLTAEPRSQLVRELLAAGFRSTATVPLWHRDAFVGFTFFDALEPGYFQPWRMSLFDCVNSALARILVRGRAPTM